MADPAANPLPTGVRAIVALFTLCSLYLAALGLLMLASPGLIGMAAGAPLLFGLELAGPYMFLLLALVSAGIAFGLARRVNLMRRAVILIAIAGVVMLVPPVSAAATMVQPAALAWGGLGIVVRAGIAWYLSREETVREFRARKTIPAQGLDESR